MTGGAIFTVLDLLSIDEFLSDKDNLLVLVSLTWGSEPAGAVGEAGVIPMPKL